MLFISENIHIAYKVVKLETGEKVVYVAAQGSVDVEHDFTIKLSVDSVNTLPGATSIDFYYDYAHTYDVTEDSTFTSGTPYYKFVDGAYVEAVLANDNSCLWPCERLLPSPFRTVLKPCGKRVMKS